MPQEKQFVDGLRFNEPHERAPKWIKGTIGVNVEKFTAYAQAHVDERGWLNIDVKESKSGNLYCELNTYKPGKRQVEPQYPEEGYGTPDVPFPTESDIRPEDLPF